MNENFDTIEEGRRLIEQIRDELSREMSAMRSTNDNEEWKKHNEKRYELIQLRRAVQGRIHNLYLAQRPK